MDKERFNWILKAIDFEKLTDWEEEFLQDCDYRIKGRELTDKEEEIVERIFRERQ